MGSFIMFVLHWAEACSIYGQALGSRFVFIFLVVKPLIGQEMHLKWSLKFT